MWIWSAEISPHFTQPHEVLAVAFYSLVVTLRPRLYFTVKALAWPTHEHERFRVLAINLKAARWGSGCNNSGTGRPLLHPPAPGDVAVEHPGRPQPGLLVPGGAVCPVVGEAGLGAPSPRRDSPTRDSLSPAISGEGIKVRGLSAGGQCSRQTMGSQYASGMMCGLDIPHYG